MSTVRPTVAKDNSSAAAAHQIHELLMDLVRATGLLQPDQVVPGFDLSMSQAFALHELDGGTPLSQRDLAERLRLEKSTVSRLAAELERKGLLVRERDPDNRRLYRLRLTDEGHALHARMRGTFQHRYARWVSAMTPAERAALLTGLPALIRAVHSPEVEGRTRVYDPVDHAVRSNA